MKVGIITFHRAFNYGAVLQCYALQEYIRSQGHDVEVIDYHQRFIDNKYRPDFHLRKAMSLLFLGRLKQLKKYVYNYRRMKEKARFFPTFCAKFLNISEPCREMSIPQSYDRYIIGSDQMWGLHCYGGYDSVYWGDFKRPKESKLFGYAISANLKYHDSLSDDQIQSAVSRFDGISFREESIRNDIERTTGYHGEVSIDPTLLVDKETWNPLINADWSNERYIALYLLRAKGKAKETILAKADRYAKRNSCKVINLTPMKYSVEDFVSIIKYAQCVFTTSFHATVFSVIFNRPFYSFRLNDGHDGRYEDLLSSLQLEHHLFDWNRDMPVLTAEDDFNLQSNLQLFRKSSIDYLYRILH